ncbi:hypothetical protein N9X63_00315 [Woeseiaceae bacterium]|jgi:hypothetical protein|nr:hypothetical protein [Woeseiaceae bacterium]
MSFDWDPIEATRRMLRNAINIECPECLGDGTDLPKEIQDPIKLCYECSGYGRVFASHYSTGQIHEMWPLHDSINEFKLSEIEKINKETTILRELKADFAFHEAKGLSKKEALDKIQKEFDNEKRKLLKLEDRVLYEQIIKEKIRAHAAEKKHGPDVKLKDLIMSKERKDNLDNLDDELVVTQEQRRWAKVSDEVYSRDELLAACLLASFLLTCSSDEPYTDDGGKEESLMSIWKKGRYRSDIKWVAQELFNGGFETLLESLEPEDQAVKDDILHMMSHLVIGLKDKLK